jgi:phosphoribosylamine--glycine ligase
MKILVLGSGGREHALSHTFCRQGHTVYCLPGNAGTKKICHPLLNEWTTSDVCNFTKVIEFVRQNHIDLTVVGPEEYLSKGIVNAFAEHNLPIFGPAKEASILETSKAWAKNFMWRHQIPTASYEACNNLIAAQKALMNSYHSSNGVVIKPSGLTGGKGVVCCDTLHEAEETLHEIYKIDPNAETVIEERLFGQEVSLLAFCDGTSIVPMIPSQDHKRLLDDNKGPNTGGMGAYAPVTFLSTQTMQEIHALAQNTMKAIVEEGIHYVGILYFGLMITNEGPKILEFNCRFGDPETQAILPLLKTDLAAVMLSCCHGKLKKCTLEWKNQSACCVVMASEGYPDNYTVGQEIGGLNIFIDDLYIFHAGTKINDIGAVVSSGGRVLGVTGIGDTLQEAVKNAYHGIDLISFPKSHYRKDIGHESLKEVDINLAARY